MNDPQRTLKYSWMALKEPLRTLKYAIQRPILNRKLELVNFQIILFNIILDKSIKCFSEPKIS